MPTRITKPARSRAARTLNIRLTGSALGVAAVGKGKPQRIQESAEEGQTVPHLGHGLQRTLPEFRTTEDSRRFAFTASGTKPPVQRAMPKMNIAQGIAGEADLTVSALNPTIPSQNSMNTKASGCMNMVTVTRAPLGVGPI